MIKLDEASERMLKIELARRDLYEYCQIMIPGQYNEKNWYLKDMCNELQDFMQNDSRHFMVLNAPPRFCKSLSGQMLVEWNFGQNINYPVMTGSYNEDVSTIFAKRVRSTILEKEEENQERIAYQEIFPKTRIKDGDASVGKWGLAGAHQSPSYLATSPSGMATGIGCKLLVVDDLIKNAEEAYSDLVKDKHWSWFKDTMMQRLEGEDWKVIIIMTRWATDDLAGRVINEYGDDVRIFSIRAWETDEEGNMIFTCPEKFGPTSYRLKTKAMNPDIVRANYNQDPIDIKGRLYADFGTYDPTAVNLASVPTHAVTDTADKGTDRLCEIHYKYVDGFAYVVDIIDTDAAMEETEKVCALAHKRNNTRESFVEGNNSGRTWMRNVRRNCLSIGYGACVFVDKFQTTNKEARILNNSGWVSQYVLFPVGWKERWPEFFKGATSYNAKGKNAHDDEVDALSYVAERCALNVPITQNEYDGENTYGQSEYEEYDYDWEGEE